MATLKAIPATYYTFTVLILSLCTAALQVNLFQHPPPPKNKKKTCFVEQHNGKRNTLWPPRSLWPRRLWFWPEAVGVVFSCEGWGARSRPGWMTSTYQEALGLKAQFWLLDRCVYRGGARDLVKKPVVWVWVLFWSLTVSCWNMSSREDSPDGRR